MAIGNSGYKTGTYVAAIGAEILNGRDPASIAIVDPKLVEVTFNLGRARALGVDLSTSELAEAANVVGQ